MWHGCGGNIGCGGVLVVILVVVWLWWKSRCWFGFGGNVVLMNVKHSLGIHNTFGDTKGGKIFPLPKPIVQMILS